MKRVLIVGATSAIAEATARLFAARGDRLFVVGRNEARLEAIAKDLSVRGGAPAHSHVMDANDLSAHAPMLEHAERALGGIDVVLIAHGTLPDQRACEASADTALAEIKTNALSIVSLLTLVANRMAQQKSGTIAVISSVAGDRGRSSNYVYGSAKALVSTFLSGLRQRLSHCGVGVVTIKPGFVDTPMTREFRKGFLWAQPSQVARGIVAAIDRQKPVVYLPSFWRLIMFIVRLVPERVFLRMKM